MTQALFDAIRTVKGSPLTQADVDLVNRALNGAKLRALKNPEAFFKGIRAVTKTLDQAQVDTINALLTSAAHWSSGWLAYGLATAWHEALFKPIREYGKGAGRSYGKPGRNGGQVPYGRGLVQLTHDDNYERADKELSLGGALIKNYDLALDPKIAVQILVRGMERGWFTGKSLGTYIGAELGTVPEFKEARRIINGTDRDDLIAGYARSFQNALVAGGW